MAADPRLRKVPLFDGLGDDDLERICQGVTDRSLAAGDVLFREGDEGDSAYIVADGELEILKATQRRDVRIAVRGPGDVIGEIAMLHADARSATVRARVDTALLEIPRKALEELLDTSPTAARRLFETLAERMRETQQETQQGQRMAQLGTLAVGIAHELNNPAAGVQRAAQQLRAELDRLSEDLAANTGETAEAAVAIAAGRRAALALLDGLEDRRVETATMSTLQRTNLEDELEQWLDDKDVEDAWDLAPGLADVGVTRADLETLVGDGDPVAVAAAVRFVVGAARLRALTDSIVEGTTRLSAIVGALKRHNFTDQAPIVDVDVVRGLEDTVLLLGHKVKRVTVQREYEDDLGTISGYGSELNQVWTNLIDNACDAMLDAELESPTLTLRAHGDGDGIVVEVEDNGPGIPAALQEQVFDAFFTTKEPGKGTGLGLQISARIIMEHDGDLDVTSAPGRTTFRIRLPRTLQERPDEGDGG